MHTDPVSPSPATQQALDDLFDRAVEQLGYDELAVTREALPHVLYEPNAASAFDRELESRDSDTRRRLRKIVEPMLDEKSALRGLAKVPGRNDWDYELRRDFPHFSGVLDQLQAEFALAALGDGALRCAPILLLGDPGIGKSYFLRTLADTLNTGFEEVHFETASAGWILGGSDSSWTNAHQGKIFDLLVGGTHANPIVLLEEIDKAGSGAKYDPLGALYSLLEGHSAACFRDECIPIPIDASRILWMATANDRCQIAQPLMSRLTPIEIPEPTPTQAVAIVRSVYRRLLDSESWGTRFDTELPDDVIDKVCLLPPRAMRKALWLACGRAAMRKVWRLSPDDVIVDDRNENQRIGFC